MLTIDWNTNILVKQYQYIQYIRWILSIHYSTITWLAFRTLEQKQFNFLLKPVLPRMQCMGLLQNFSPVLPLSLHSFFAAHYAAFYPQILSTFTKCMDKLDLFLYIVIYINVLYINTPNRP